MSGVLLTDDIAVEGCSPSGGVVAVWTLHRPEKLNALNRDSHLAIKEQCVRVESDDAVRAVVIRGAAPPTPEEGSGPNRQPSLLVQISPSSRARTRTMYVNSSRTMLGRRSGVFPSRLSQW